MRGTNDGGILMRQFQLILVLAFAGILTEPSTAQSPYPAYGQPSLSYSPYSVPAYQPHPDDTEFGGPSYRLPNDTVAYSGATNTGPTNTGPTNTGPTNTGPAYTGPGGYDVGPTRGDVSGANDYRPATEQPQRPYSPGPTWAEPPRSFAAPRGDDLGDRAGASIAQAPTSPSDSPAATIPLQSGAATLDPTVSRPAEDYSNSIEAMTDEIADNMNAANYLHEPSAYWFVQSKWEGSVEVGLNGSAGNSESLSIQSGFDLKLVDGDYKWQSDLYYVKTTTDTTETQHNALFNYGFKRGFGESPWSVFAKSALEYDEFKAWDVRWSINTGLGFRLWKSDITELTSRFGAGTSREFGGPDKSWAQEAVFGLDYERQISKRQKLKFTSDYFPEWQNFADYRLVTTSSWEFLLDEENNLSLKLDVTDRYDSTPSGRKPNDINYSLLLLGKT